jgi:hypothetical protein
MGVHTRGLLADNYAGLLSFLLSPAMKKILEISKSATNLTDVL